MNIQEQFGQVTEDGCKKYLNVLSGINPGANIGELQEFLKNRLKEVQNEKDVAKEQFCIDNLNKCFTMKFIDYSKDISYLLIWHIKFTKLYVEKKYGDFVIKYEAEVIKNYKGQINISTQKDNTIEDLKAQTEDWKEISAEQFHEYTTLYIKLSETFNKGLKNVD